MPLGRVSCSPEQGCTSELLHRARPPALRSASPYPHTHPIAAQLAMLANPGAILNHAATYPATQCARTPPQGSSGCRQDLSNAALFHRFATSSLPSLSHGDSDCTIPLWHQPPILVQPNANAKPWPRLPPSQATAGSGEPFQHSTQC